MTAEVEERPRLVTASTGVNGLISKSICKIKKKQNKELGDKITWATLLSSIHILIKLQIKKKLEIKKLKYLFGLKGTYNY